MPFRFPPTGQEPSLPIPPGGTATAARAFDWSSTPLGPAADWPPTLKAAASIVLGSNVPMILAWGPELIVIHNDSYGEMLGDRHRGLGRPISEIWAHNWDIVGANVERTMKGETVYIERAPRRLLRGETLETHWITGCYNPVIDESERPVGLFGVITAVVDEQTERSLRESEERFRLIADSAPALIWVTQLDRKRSFVNRAYVDFLDITYEQAVDFDWRTIIHPDDQQRILAESIAGETSLRPFVLEGRYRRGDGEWRWVRSISQPRWGAGGEHLGFIGVAHDITEAKLAEQGLREMNETLERRVEERTAELRSTLEKLRAEVAERERAEQALRQAQKMEAVGQLTGGIAHDFNNLLTPVIGGLEIITRNLQDERLKRIADTALESSRRGAKLTTQLLTFSRLQRIQMAPVDVNRVITQMREILHHTIGPDVSVSTHLVADAGLAQCDENQLENAILNLAINARDAMPEGGKLSISTEMRRIEGQGDLGDGDYVCIKVVDDGEGMEPDVLARATEPFFSTKPLGKGTGLGLAQVYGIARQSGGTLRIDSDKGKGTTVCVFLPAAGGVVAEAAEVGEASRQSRSKGGTVFLVDDDPDVRAFLCDLLEELGHSVKAFASGPEALEALATVCPDLILVDFAMPGMNGAELAGHIRSRHPGLPIIFVTGFAESDQLEAATAGGSPVLRKPFGMDELARMVASVIGGEPLEPVKS
ncbi:MAG TPA: response regulator [Allosphingosinicella sp.]|nr:response regulator [Allosphingosinicella sp.]